MLRNAPIKIPEEIEKRLYQLVISRLNGDEIHQTYYRTALRDLVKKGIGGFIVFGGAMKKPETGKENNHADNDHGRNGRRTIHSEIIHEHRQNLIAVSVIKRFGGVFHFL